MSLIRQGSQYRSRDTGGGERGEFDMGSTRTKMATRVVKAREICATTGVIMIGVSVATATVGVVLALLNHRAHAPARCVERAAWEGNRRRAAKRNAAQPRHAMPVRAGERYGEMASAMKNAQRGTALCRTSSFGKIQFR